jgi:periplasmic divalent cation tolerance protein
MLIAWTTLANRPEAEKLAQAVVAGKLAVCVQVEGPITSFYIWNDRLEREEEYRLLFKLLPAQAAALESLVMKLHPYAIPEWLVVPAEHVGEKYLSWARASSTSSPL